MLYVVKNIFTLIVWILDLFKLSKI